MSQLQCNGCRTTLMYPSGAPSVHCPRCSTITPAFGPSSASSTSQITCSGCRVRLMYPAGAPAVQCARCNVVTLVNQSPGSSHDASSPGPSNPIIVVENPDTLDERTGKVIRSEVVIGTASQPSSSPLPSPSGSGNHVTNSQSPSSPASRPQATSSPLSSSASRPNDIIYPDTVRLE
eukprot:CAMPEP_0196657228 /NCGR_PEP_ID=MMETSP1086-20130531/22522_1 /TAXON_ID=77921 /ORGANISM="Cyanoptyche  gloeocystis , Strain SAG4.97" /LENGTH=176 /DNA_ID=CAMNT_0041990281 /DNA_START=128 /DNA_END=658 /DNA_ORIENTATION=-